MFDSDRKFNDDLQTLEYEDYYRQIEREVKSVEQNELAPLFRAFLALPEDARISRNYLIQRIEQTLHNNHAPYSMKLHEFYSARGFAQTEFETSITSARQHTEEMTDLIQSHGGLNP